MRNLGALAAVIALLAALLWVAGELHYRNCRDSAPDRVTVTGIDIATFGEETETAKQLRQLRRGCSRLPF